MKNTKVLAILDIEDKTLYEHYEDVVEETTDDFDEAFPTVMSWDDESGIELYDWTVLDPAITGDEHDLEVYQIVKDLLSSLAPESKLKSALQEAVAKVQPSMEKIERGESYEN
jgi:hypothetical protein